MYINYVSDWTWESWQSHNLWDSFYREPHPVSFFFSALVKKKTIWKKKKAQFKMTGKEWKNQASSDVWNVLLLIFHVRNT